MTPGKPKREKQSELLHGKRRTQRELFRELLRLAEAYMESLPHERCFCQTSTLCFHNERRREISAVVREARARLPK